MVLCCLVTLDLPIVPLKIKHKPEISTHTMRKDTKENQSKGAQWKPDKLLQLVTGLSLYRQTKVNERALDSDQSRIFFPPKFHGTISSPPRFYTACLYFQNFKMIHILQGI